MSKLSDALATLDKATPGPWKIMRGSLPNFDGSDGLVICPPDAESGKPHWVIAMITDESSFENRDLANATLITAAPDAIAWIKEALPYITEYRDALATNLENCDFGPREEGAARKELARLDAIIARAKPEV